MTEVCHSEERRGISPWTVRAEEAQARSLRRGEGMTGFGFGNDFRSAVLVSTAENFVPLSPQADIELPRPVRKEATTLLYRFR